MERQKVVVLVRAGSYGWMKPGEYDEWIENAKHALEGASPPAAVEVIDGVLALHERLAQSGVDAVVFFSRGIIDTALEVQERYKIKVVLLTGLTTGLSEFELKVTVLNKSKFRDEEFHRVVLS